MSLRARRIVVVATILSVGVFGYILLLTRFDVLERPDEQQFGIAANQAGIELYLQPTVIDPVNDTMQLRISVMPPRAAAGGLRTTPDRDFTLIVRHGIQTERLQIRANQPYPEANFSFDLDDGSIHAYPLDHYNSEVFLSCFELGSNAETPLRITHWEGVLGFTVYGRETAAQNGEVELHFAVHRTGAIAFFGIAVYAAMIVMALCALTIGTLIFVGVRKIEVTLVGAVGAIVFAMPALRNALPGSPPLGVLADVLVFFWAELGAVIALGLFITTWARSGARP